MKRIGGLFVVALFFLGWAPKPVVAQSVSIDYDHSVNFAKLTTYTWANVHATEPSVEGRVSIAANRTLASRYMKEAGKNADVTMTAVEASKDPHEYSAFYTALTDWTWQRGWDNGFLDKLAGPENIPLYTLVLDMYDTKTHKLLWRGAVTLTADQATGSDADQRFDKAVTQLIAKYPPRFQK